jgi:hypothetical protein
LEHGLEANGYLAMTKQRERELVYFRFPGFQVPGKAGVQIAGKKGVVELVDGPSFTRLDVIQENHLRT